MIQKILAGFTCVLHLYVFVLESFFWSKDLGLKTFRMSREQAEAGKLLAFNQGFYNLFIAIAIIVGSFLIGEGSEVQGQILIDYAMASAIGAGLVLIYSAPRLLRPGLIQASPGIVYFLLRIFA